MIQFTDSSKPAGIPFFLNGCSWLLVSEKRWLPQLHRQLLLRQRVPAELTVWKVTAMTWTFQMCENGGNVCACVLVCEQVITLGAS